MSARTTMLLGSLLFVFARVASAQHEGHQMPGMTTDACRDQSVRAIAVIDAADQRIELARQTNSPSAMRAAVDDLQAALGRIKVQLGPCAQAVTGSTDAGIAADVQSKTPSTPASQVASARLAITLKTQPNPPKVGENQFEVTVKRPDGTPVSSADVSILFVMPAMPEMKMPEMRNEVKLKAAAKPAPEGTYTGTGQVLMAGAWSVTISVKQNGKELDQKKVTVTVK
jgi:hypothetical protein